MLIQEKTLKHWIDYFYGYGSWEAPIWFVGYEEGGGDLPEEVADKFNYFYNATNISQQPTLCDIRDLYQQVGFYIDGPKGDLFKTRYDYRFSDRSVLHGVWKNLISFVHGFLKEPLPDLLAYQKSTFAHPITKRESLIQLYPLPSPHNHGWYYSWLDMPQFPFLKHRHLYEEYVYDQRIQTIIHAVKQYKPSMVVMYGMRNINGLKKSVQDVFSGAKFSMVKAVKQQIPQHHRTDLQGTQFLITTQIPALRHGRIETGFDWFSFGEMYSK